jgi:hypothetical protein
MIKMLMIKIREFITRGVTGESFPFLVRVSCCMCLQAKCIS